MVEGVFYLIGTSERAVSDEGGWGEHSKEILKIEIILIRKIQSWGV